MIGMSGIILYDVVGIVGFFFICHALLLSYVSAKDTLAPGEYILPTDEVYLRSSNKIFELKLIRGPPGNSSTSSCYLCIQFTEYPILAASQQMIVWVTWLGQAETSSVPVLKMERDGRLVVSADHEFVVNDDRQYPYAMNTTATLLDTGNLVLRIVGGHTHTSWQSFDHPTANTLLPGMILGSRFGVKTRGVHCLTSWTSEGNPSPGDFSLCVDPNNPKQLIATRKGIVYWNSGVLSEHNNNFPFLPVLSHHLTYFFSDNESYFAWDGNVDPHSTFIRILATGEISVAINHDRNLSRASINCDHNGTYYSNEGCVTSSDCTARDKFSSTTAFIQWELQLNDTKGDCNEMCVNNCSCNAYATLESDGTGCKFSSFTAYRYVSNGGETFYIRDAKTANQTHLPPPPYPAPALTRSMSHHRRTTIVAALTVTLFVTLAVVFLVWYMNRRKCCSCFEAPIVPSSSQQLASKDEELPFFNFKSIELATNYFSDENKLGQGGFGPVYKGILANGQEIAAKRLSKMSGHGIEQFKNEVLLISKLQHRNLVRLFGCCTQGEERILIYEYITNKSLDSILFDARKKTCLDWGKRVSIIDGITQGLLYLHKYSRLKIIHRDLKTSNILLDVHMHPKISDFGTARIFEDSDSPINTKSIIGTYGYMSPEYAMDGCFSEKSDIFSFGVMIIEIVSGKRNNGFYNPDRVSNILGYAWDLWIEGRLSDLIDSTMEKTISIIEATRYIQVGLLCVQDSATDRPTISDVVSMLGNELIVLPTPKQPGFSAIIGLKCVDVVNNLKACSCNDVTITDIEGR
ncbi:PREDICTED: G-type lectin S-receptor-like serine/threonine-protein kinase At1g67520 [Ipomoea nil]|uniref:G-type lectin S-receptor-like serine/threonine-protein kinase At1g67520 n=1 Tax=Ipomoea nil TaxID=35883 RepID=UPI000901F819|nr:PREDICTED: G-type lectin S-receptor-like serine/threonine-protein kinase At1g67520 [Ipomoea nil]